MKEIAKRYNNGKIRLDLIPPKPLELLAEVYTNGGLKYTVFDDQGKILEDGADNWRKGMSWSQTMASVKRHIMAWEKGEDIDPDPKMRTYHLANAAWGLFTLLEFYKTHPEFDDRKHTYLNRPKIGLDIDEVICDWVGAWRARFGYDLPNHWRFSYDTTAEFKSMTPKELEDFYLSIQPKIDPKSIPFEPHCYITSRPVPIEVTKRWIQKNGFPTADVYSVGLEKSKVDVAKESGLDWFVDDRYDNFVELNRAGICTFLMDAAHNQKYNVGYKRIKNLSELL